MKILAAYYTHKPGGFCVRLYRLLNALSARGNEVVYCSLDAPPDAVAAAVTFRKIPFPMKARRGILFWGVFTLWLPLYLVFICRRERPARVVVFGAYYGFASKAASLLCGSRQILFLRSLTFRIDELTGKPAWLRSVTGLVDRLGIRGADRVVAMTEAMRAEAAAFAGRPAGDFSIVPNDIPRIENAERLELPEAARRCAEAGGMVIGAAGVLDQRKNMTTLIEAMGHLARKGLAASVHLVIAGDGSSRADLEHLAARVSPGSVTFVGWIQKPAGLFRSVGLLAHPSLHEGVPNTVLEALAVGCPVLLSDIPEHREIVPESSFRVPPSDVAAWAAVIERFIVDADFRAATAAASAAARERLTFDWDDSASRAALL